MINLINKLSESKLVIHVINYCKLGLGGLNCSDWCVASNEAPDNVVQKGLDWVCQYGLHGACDSIQRSEPCHIPNDLRGVASVVFNQYWQTIKHSGYVCDKLLDGATTLVHIDPSKYFVCLISN